MLATSDTSERNWSVWGQIYTKHCNKLSLDNKIILIRGTSNILAEPDEQGHKDPQNPKTTPLKIREVRHSYIATAYATYLKIQKTRICTTLNPGPYPPPTGAHLIPEALHAGLNLSTTRGTPPGCQAAWVGAGLQQGYIVALLTQVLGGAKACTYVWAGGCTLCGPLARACNASTCPETCLAGQRNTEIPCKLHNKPASVVASSSP
eukprot:355993-Chlamydomonas_euryale.AAC.7